MNFYKIVSSSKFYVPVITIMVTIIIICSLSRLVNKLVNNNAKNINDKRKNTIVVLLNSIIKYALILIDLIIILGAWGINVTGFITGLGVAGVIAGLALQDALKDIIMGCNIIMDGYFVVGDYVKINDFTGEVVEFGLKNTKLKNAAGNVYIIANREISNVLNYSINDFCLGIELDVAYEEDADKVNKVLNKMLDELKEEGEIRKDCSCAGINSLDQSSIKYLLCIYCNPKTQNKKKRMILDRVVKEFNKNNIKIPYAQIEVHNGK